MQTSQQGTDSKPGQAKEASSFPMCPLAALRLRRRCCSCAAQVVDTETGEFKIDKVRTSSGYFLKRGQTPIVKRIEHRLAEWTRLPVENGEPIHVLRYQVISIRRRQPDTAKASHSSYCPAARRQPCSCLVRRSMANFARLGWRVCCAAWGWWGQAVQPGCHGLENAAALLTLPCHCLQQGEKYDAHMDAFYDQRELSSHVCA